MSLTTVHRNHVRLLRKAYQLGDVIVALTSDEEVFKSKGFYPMLSFEQKEKEIALAFKYVQEVIKCKWLIDEKFMDLQYRPPGPWRNNQNPVPREKLVIFKRTTGISSTQLRNSGS